ncbi:replication protein P [Yersinia enterocolitica]|uniref:replication protein P n=1 Tax=Yersinia enterocolitica TaxID=630 RepID=UPI00398D4733
MSNRLLKVIENQDASALARMSGPAPAENVIGIVNPEAEKMVDRLFKSLKQVFPAASQTNLRSQSDEDAAKKQWIAAFAENGIRSLEQIQAGMQYARANGSPFWPSPGQFITWCKQGATRAAGLPDADELFDMVMDYAKRRDMFSSAEAFPWPSNPAYWMVTKIYSQQRVQGLSEQNLRKRCGKELTEMSKRIEAGEPIPAPVVQIPKLHIPVSNEKALDHIAELRAKLNMTRKS